MTRCRCCCCGTSLFIPRCFEGIGGVSISGGLLVLVALVATTPRADAAIKCRLDAIDRDIC